MFRRSKKLAKSASVPAPRATPELPELSSPTLEWPDNFVATARASFTHTDESGNEDGTATPKRSHSARPMKTSFVASPEHGAAIPSFHKPFRSPDSPPRPPIATLYTSHPPSSFDYRSNGNNVPPFARRSSSSADASRKKIHRRQRAVPTFNLMVCGGQGAGKTSLLRLILDSSDLSPSSSHDQRAAVDRFLRGHTKTTESIEAVCIEISESRTDRLLLSVVDTPGFDFRDRRELKLERQVSEVIKYVDALYAETMGEESKLIRENKGDQHIHLCIYMIDPSSILSSSTPPSPDPDRPLSDATLKIKDLLTAATIPTSPPTQISEDADDDAEPPERPLVLRAAEVRVLERLAKRMNVLPVLGRADSLTEDAIATAKAVVRRDLAAAGVDLGLFASAAGPAGAATVALGRTISFASDSEPRDANGGDSTVRGRGNTRHASEPASEATSEDEEEPGERPVIKLRRPSQNAAARRSRSRSRLRGDDSALGSGDELDEPDPAGVPAVRFGAGAVAVHDVGELLPFAFIAPERTRPRPRPVPSRRPSEAAAPPLPVRSPARTISTATAPRAPPAGVDPLRGVFVRRFRWGTADALDAAHCDFAALRTAALTTHLGRLKARTREVLYEAFRTEKLLARRVTNGLSQEDADRLLEELGLMGGPQSPGVEMDIGSRISSILDYGEARLAG